MTTPATPHLATPLTRRDHVLGPADAPATLVEYGDFECPFCGQAYPLVKEVRQLLGERLRFAFRHFPRPEHPHARHAAEATEAAAAQAEAAFWALHDTLFEHQQALTDADLARYAAGLGLDMARFGRDLAQHNHRERVQADIESGVHSDAHGTPTFFINGAKYDGPLTLDALLGAIRANTGVADDSAGTDWVADASDASFPASDPPGWIPLNL